MHTMYANENQPNCTANYTIFVAEVASTFNEQLLLDYLLKKSEDKELKIAMREKDEMKKNVVTMVRAAVKQYEVDNRVELDDEGVTEIISKEYAPRCKPCCQCLSREVLFRGV